MVRMNRRDWKKIRRILESGWSKKTAHPDYRDDYDDYVKKGIPSYGQCYVTARAIHKVFKGKIIYNKEKNHYWNMLPDGTELDFTSDQFHGKFHGDGINPVKNLEGKIDNRKYVYPPSNDRVRKYFEVVLDKLKKAAVEFKKTFKKENQIIKSNFT